MRETKLKNIKVKELIKYLQTIDQELPVMIDNGDYGIDFKHINPIIEDVILDVMESKYYGTHRLLGDVKESAKRFNKPESSLEKDFKKIYKDALKRKPIKALVF